MWIMGNKKYETPGELLDDLDWTEIATEEEFDEWLDSYEDSVWILGHSWPASEALKTLDYDLYLKEYYGKYVLDEYDYKSELAARAMERMIGGETIVILDKYEVTYEEDEEEVDE